MMSRDDDGPRRYRGDEMLRDLGRGIALRLLVLLGLCVAFFVVIVFQLPLAIYALWRESNSKRKG